MIGSMKMRAAGVFALGALALTLGYGFVQVESQSAPMFTQNGRVISTAPGLSLNPSFGGGIYATSTNDTTATMLASDIDVENVVDFTPLVPSITLALPASSTLNAMIPNAGDTRSIIIRNATTTAGSNGSVTIAGGTGTLLKRATSTSAILGDTDGSNFALVTFTRKADTDIIAAVQMFID